MKSIIALLVACICCIPLAASAQFTRTVALGWTANTETDLAGYKLHYGNTSGTYTTTITIPDPTAITYSIDLPVGTYYFVLTAYDTGTNESGYSNEVSASILDAPQNFNVTFTWNNYTQSNVIDGFKIYYGPISRGNLTFPSEPHPYTDIVTAYGAALTTYTTEIPAGEYYFALSAYSESNPSGYQDSPFSNEVYASIQGETYTYPQTPTNPIIIPLL
jgi:hypothetical protein